MSILFTPRLSWSQVLAFAWWSTEQDIAKPTFLDDLRQDPKIAINELAKGEEGKYKDILLKVSNENTRKSINSAANEIMQLAEQDPSDTYRGYLPIPKGSEVGALADLDRKKLTGLLEVGITGILKFNEQADLWADELVEAWKSQDRLIAVLQDPAKNLLHKDNLKPIFPLPDLPRGLKELQIEQLQEFLGDEDHMQHLGGVFLIGS